MLKVSVSADEEKKDENEVDNDKEWNICDCDRLYNILPFNCLIIDIRSTEKYNKAHIWKSNSFPINMDEIKETHDEYQNIVTKLANIFSAKSAPSSLKAKILKRFIIVSDDNDSNDTFYSFIHSIFKKVKSEDSFIEKYELYVLSQTFDEFYAKYPFYAVMSHSNDENTYYPNAILLNKLYLGTGQQAVTSKIMKNLKITHIVNVTKEIGCPFDNDKDKIKYIQIEVNDLENASIDKYFDKVGKFMNNALSVNDGDNDNRIMVHCEMGVSRSSSFVLIYLMKYKDMRLSEAYKHVKKCREIIHPNNGFFKQLIEFEKSLYGETTEKVITEELKLREINVDQKVANLKMGLVQAIAIKKNKFHNKANSKKKKKRKKRNSQEKGKAAEQDNSNHEQVVLNDVVDKK